MEWINRYVYAVTRTLPEKQREDIEKELRSLIDDMVEGLEGSDDYENKVKEALLGLGHPDILADNYRGSGRYLIGPQNYDKYIQVLKIVITSIFIGISVALTVGNIFSDSPNIYELFVDYFGALTQALFQGFAWTTLGFAIAERNNINVDRSIEKKEWKLSDLPLIPAKKARISPVDPIFSIVFSSMFFSVVYFQPQLFAAYIPNSEGYTLISIFNLDELIQFKLLFVFVYIFAVAKEVLKLISRRWTLKMSIGFTVLSFLSNIILLYIFTKSGIWNPDFSMEVIKAANLDFNINQFWLTTQKVFILTFVFVFIIEASTALYKGIKYNDTK